VDGSAVHAVIVSSAAIAPDDLVANHDR